MIFSKLYSRTSCDAIQTWQIIVNKNSYYTISGQLNGKLVISKPTFCKPKNVGKKNETSAEEQAIKEAKAKWEKKIKENYKEDISKIDEIDFFEPMLAKNFKDYQDKIKYPVAVEEKLNGIRCILTSKGAFSRKGEQFFCVEHIKESVYSLFKKYPNLILDGELYNPEYKNKLNQIASLVSVNRKEKDITIFDIEKSKEIIQFHVFDALNYCDITKRTPYSRRKERLLYLIKGVKYLLFVEEAPALSYDAIIEYLEECKIEKKEGLMIKIMDAPYENKRSKNILKLKIFADEEFKIIGFEEGEGNWTGCVKKVICRLNKPAKDGRKQFDSNIRGTMEELAELWKNKNNHLNKWATISYQEKSEYGIPLIPYTSLPFRDFE